MIYSNVDIDTDNIDNEVSMLFEDFNIRADVTREELVDMIRGIIKDNIKEGVSTNDQNW